MRYLPPALDAPQTAPQIAVPQQTAQYGRDGPAGIRGRGPEHQRNDRKMPAHKKNRVGMTPQMQCAAGKLDSPPTPNDRSTQHLCLTAGELLTLCIKGETGPISRGRRLRWPRNNHERVNISRHAALPNAWRARGGADGATDGHRAPWRKIIM